MLATTGTDIEFVPRNVDEVKEQEQQAVEELDVYHKAMFNHLNPECADFDDDKRDEDDMANMVITFHHLIIINWQKSLFPIFISRLHLPRWH